MHLVLSTAGPVHDVQVNRRDRHRGSWGRLEVEDQAEAASKPLLRALEVVLAPGQPDDLGIAKWMPRQDGVAVKRHRVLARSLSLSRHCSVQFQIFDSI